MAEGHNPSKQDLDFLADINASFGKKAKVKREPTDADIRKGRNSAWHIANPSIQSAAGKLPESELQYVYADAKAGVPQPITPVARVSFIVHQHCETCKQISWYTGHEYIRFNRRILKMNIIGFGEVQAPSTILRQLKHCDPDLVAFGPATGVPLPRVIEEHHEEVPQCPACIILERHCVDLWLDDAKRKAAQPELPLEHPQQPKEVAPLVIPGLETL